MSSLQQRVSRFLHEDPLLRRVLKNTGYLFSSSTASMVFVAVQSILVARLLGVETLGVITVAMTFVTMVNQLFSFRMGEFVVRYFGKSVAEGNQAHASATVKASVLVEGVTSLVAFGFLLLVAPLGARFVAKDSGSLILFQIFGLAILANLMTETSNGVLRVLNHYKVQGWITLIQTILTFSMITLAFIFKGNVMTVLLAYLIGKVFLGFSPVIAAAFYMRKEVDRDWWRTKLTILPALKDMTRFAVSTNLSGTLKLVVSESEPFWVGLLLNTEAVGLYKVALAIVGLLIIPVTPFNFTAFPEITRSVASKTWQQLRRLLKRVSILSAAWTIGVTLFMAVLGKWLIGVTYGNEFTPSYISLMILLIGFGISNIFFWNRSLLLSFGNAHIPLYVMAGGGVLKIGLSLLLVPRFGMNVEALLLSAYFVLTVGIMVILGYDLIKKAESLETSAGEA